MDKVRENYVGKKREENLYIPKQTAHTTMSCDITCSTTVRGYGQYLLFGVPMQWVWLRRNGI